MTELIGLETAPSEEPPQRRHPLARVGRVLTILGGLVLIFVGVVRVGDIPGHGLWDLPIGAVFFPAGFFVLWAQARRSGPVRRRRAVSWLLLVLGTAALVAGAVRATTPFGADAGLIGPAQGSCGSAVAPRQFRQDVSPAGLGESFVAIGCEGPVHDRQGQSIGLGVIGILLAGYALSRQSTDSSGSALLDTADVPALPETSTGSRLLVHPGRFVVAVLLMLAALGTALAVRTQQAVEAAENVRPSVAARPTAADTCGALGAWNRGIVDDSTTGGRAMAAASDLAGKRTAAVALIQNVADRTQELLRQIDDLQARYHGVRGVPELLGVIRARFRQILTRVDRLADEARAMPVDSTANFDEAKKHLAEGMSSASGGLTYADLRIPHVGDTASVALTFQLEPSCAPIFH
jgi:hypothetical protein